MKPLPLLLAAFFGLLALTACAASAPPPSPAALSSPAAVIPTSTPPGPSFSADILPIFTARCIRCHRGETPPRGLRLDSYAGILAGGTYRAVVLPGNPQESELLRRIKGETLPRMPFDGPPFLDAAQIRQIEAWIAAGAPDN